ncbi:MAG: Rho-binding antiterminator [Thiobacillaceae bacterium]
MACVLHERLEFAVLRRLPLQLRWRDETGSHAARVQPLDVTTRDGAEWLTLRQPDGSVLQVRLDRIEAITETPGV